MTGPGDLSVRRAGVADLPAIRSIADAEEQPPDATTGGFPEALDTYYRHLIEHGDVSLAEASGDAVGFGGIISSGGAVHLADLFVRRDRQGSGVGRRLLEDLFGDRWPRTTFSSDDPRALPLYVRFGMRPWFPNLYLAGDAPRLPSVPRGVVVERARWQAVAELERDWWGIDRPSEHRHWAGGPNAVSLIVHRGRTPVAAGHARSRLRGGGRWMDAFFVAPAEEPVAPTIAALRWSADAEGRIGACALGPNPIVPTLIDAGFRVLDRDIYQASEPDLVDPNRRLVNTGIL